MPDNNAFLIRLEALADGSQCIAEGGVFLRSYDADEPKAVWTNDLSVAKRFPTSEDAIDEWKKPSATRVDRRGQPIRPMTAFTIEILSWADAMIRYQEAAGRA